MSIDHLQSVATVPAIARDSDLAPVHLGTHFRISATGLTVIGEPSFEVCEQFWQTAKTLHASLGFAIGDAILYFEARWGEAASQIIDASGLSDETCRVYKWMAERIPPANRMLDRGLTVAHHQAVAALPAPQQLVWLKRAIEGDDRGTTRWTVNRMKQEIKANGETVEVAWHLMIRLDSRARLDRLQKQLELDGYACAALVRRGIAGEPKA